MSKIDKPTYKQIAFDLDTHVAKEIAGKKYTQMYAIIQAFMKEAGFKHQQGSVYVSKQPISFFDVTTIADTFREMYPYISKAIRDITVTKVDKLVFSLNGRFTYTGSADEYVNYTDTHELKIPKSKDINFQR